MTGFWVSMGLAIGVALAAGLPLAWAYGLCMRRWSGMLILAPLMLLAFQPPERWHGYSYGPLMVVLVAGSEFGPLFQRFGNAARSLGASESRIFFRVVLPLAWDSVCMGLAFTVVLSLLFGPWKVRS